MTDISRRTVLAGATAFGLALTTGLGKAAIVAAAAEPMSEEDLRFAMACCLYRTDPQAQRDFAYLRDKWERREWQPIS